AGIATAHRIDLWIAGQRPALPEHRRRMSIGVIAGIAHDAGILACDHEDRHKGAYFDRHLTTDPE
ncbi:hypothetical protein, partial [Stenotrophomonas maltophilia]